MAEIKEGVCNKDLASLALKIVKMGKAIGKMEEDGKNNHSNYKFVSSENVLAKVRSHLEEFKLCIMPSIIDDIETLGKSSGGKEIIRTRLCMEFLIIDIETGYSITRSWRGADQDTGGKSFGQATTESVKRFYFKLFNVSSKDDIDPDTNTTPAKPKATAKPSLESIRKVAKIKENDLKKINNLYDDKWFKEKKSKITKNRTDSTTEMNHAELKSYISGVEAWIEKEAILNQEQERVSNIDNDIPPEVSDVAQKTNEKKEVKK